METILSEAIRSDPRLEGSVTQASRVLEDVMGSSGRMAIADWDLVRDHNGRPLVVIQLKDFAGSANGIFAPDELEDRQRLWNRLYRLWGDLLQDRSQKQVRRVEQVVSQLGPED